MINEKCEKDNLQRIEKLTGSILELKEQMRWAEIDRHFNRRHVRLSINEWNKTGGIYCRTYAHFNKVLFGKNTDYSKLTLSNLDLLRTKFSLRQISELTGISKIDGLYYRMPKSDLTLKNYLTIKHCCEEQFKGV